MPVKSKRRMIFRTRSDRGAFAFTSQANRTTVSLEANRDHLSGWVSVRLFGPHPSFDGLCSHQPTRSAPAILFSWVEPNKAGVNTLQKDAWPPVTLLPASSENRSVKPVQPRHCTSAVLRHYTPVARSRSDEPRLKLQVAGMHTHKAPFHFPLLVPLPNIIYHISENAKGRSSCLMLNWSSVRVSSLLSKPWSRPSVLTSDV